MGARHRHKGTHSPGGQADRVGKSSPAKTHPAKATSGSEARIGASLGPVSRRRLWLFRAVAVLAGPLALLVVLELGLRIAGYGCSTDAFSTVQVKGKAHYCDNADFQRRFFPRSMARPFDPFAIPVEKTADTYRIFVLGSSAAQGTPDGAYSFSRMLQAMLESAWPALRFEVVNVAATAINSHVVLEIARDCARRQGDLFVVYMGNNEVVGPYGAGTMSGPFLKHPALIRLHKTVKASRLGQLLTAISERLDTEKRTGWRGLEMFTDRQVPADDPVLDILLGHFRRNLRDIIAAGREAGMPTVLCTVACNLRDCPPFASLHRADLTEAQRRDWQRIYDQGVQSEQVGEYAGAIECFLWALEIDDHFADLHFRLGRCYWETGCYEQARGRFELARRLDSLRFRADETVNQVIRETAAEGGQGVYLVDVAAKFADDSPHGVPGGELFHEHVHLTFHGNHVLAMAVFERLAPLIAERAKPTGPASTGPLSEEQCAERLVYTDWARHQILDTLLRKYVRRPPFTNQLYHRERVADMEQRRKALSAALTPQTVSDVAGHYQRTLERYGQDVWLRMRYAELLRDTVGDCRGAAEQCRYVVDALPGYAMGHILLAQTLGAMRQDDEAIRHYQRALRITESAEAHYGLAIVHDRRGRTEEAVKHYRRALVLQADHPGATLNLGAALHRAGRTEEAIDLYRQAARMMPESVDVRVNLGVLYQTQGRIAEAVAALEAARRLDPNSPDIRRMLGILGSPPGTPKAP